MWDVRPSYGRDVTTRGRGRQSTRVCSEHQAQLAAAGCGSLVEALASVI
jgi:hypothetical protein